MKSAIALLSVLALIGYAAADVNGPFSPYIQEYEPAYGQVQDLPGSRGYGYGQMQQSDLGDTEQFMQSEIDRPTADTLPASLQALTKESVTVDSLTSGAVEAVYRLPNKGRVHVNLRNNKEDILIHIDARVSWGSPRNVLVLNSKPANGGWQQEVHPKGFPFPCCGYVTTIALRVEITSAAFVISANDMPIAKFPYRTGLRPPVDKIEYIFDDTGASVKAKLESLTVEY